jgi:2,3-bisphosphoglycerate-dependent phosphoglycerate mutase/probable phosphoglycerate mutase
VAESLPHPRFVWLVRHGQTDWNLSRRYLSTSDRPLTAFGVRQARALAAYFDARKIDVILHTGLSRTRETAEAIRGVRKIDLIEDARWREAAHGDWEGLTHRQVMAQHRETALRRFADPVHVAPAGGESLTALQARIQAAYASLGAAYAGKRVLLVSHGGAIQALLCTLMNTPLAEHWRWRIDLGSVSGFDAYPGTTILRRVNAVPLC